jgi:hypothetical protein
MGQFWAKLCTSMVLVLADAIAMKLLGIVFTIKGGIGRSVSIQELRQTT